MTSATSIYRARFVEYARTFGFSEQVAAGKTPQSTQVALPSDLDQGPANLYVVANGIASPPLRVIVQ